MEALKIDGVLIDEVAGGVLSIIKADKPYSTLIKELDKIIQSDEKKEAIDCYKVIKKQCEDIRSNLLNKKKIAVALNNLFNISPRTMSMIVVLGSSRFNLKSSMEALEESVLKGETSEGEYLKMANHYKMIHTLREASGNSQLNSYE